MGVCSQTILEPAASHLVTGREPSDPWEFGVVRRILAGDQIAFRDLVERYQSRIYWIIYGILRNRNDAEDIAQEVFAKAYFAIGGFEFRSSLFTWIQRITINECYAYLRKEQARKRSAETLTIESNQSVAGHEPAADKVSVQRDFINKVLMFIPEDDRMLLIWREVEGCSIAEMAEMTSLNESTVKIRLFRARQKLAKAARRLTAHSGRSGVVSSWHGT